MKKAFTLIEMMIAISIFAIVSLFLYKSYYSLNQSNLKYEELLKKSEKFNKIKKTIYLDFTLALSSDISILNQEKIEDVVLFQTTNSIHNRINPYVGYIIKDKTLYRIESLNKLTYPLDAELDADVDKIAKVKRFRVYKALKKINSFSKTLYLVDIIFENGNRILYKIDSLNN